MFFYIPFDNFEIREIICVTTIIIPSCLLENERIYELRAYIFLLLMLPTRICKVERPRDSVTAKAFRVPRLFARIPESILSQRRRKLNAQKKKRNINNKTIKVQFKK